MENIASPNSSGNFNNEKKKLKKRPPPPPPGIKDDLTTIAHCTLFIYVLIICYLCFSHPFTFFDWHPLLLSIGWALLTTEAVLFISKENPVSRQITRTWKLRWHWALLILAGFLILSGTVVAISNKTRLNKQHFKSWHAIFGLLANVCYTLGIINGIPALFDTELKKIIKPNLNKTFHQASGTVGYIFGGLALILSVFTKWFANYSGNNKYIFLIAFISVTFSFVWTLQRPFLKCLRKILKVPF